MDQTMEAAVFWLATLGVVLGLAIVLYGVSLNSGAALNTPMLAGGVVLLTAIALHTAGILRSPDRH